MKNEAKDKTVEMGAVNPFKIMESILQELGIQVWIKDKDGRYTYANQTMMIADGITDNDIIGKTDDEVYDSEMAEIFKEFDKKTILRGESCIMSYELPNGNYEEVHKRPIFDKDGNFIGTYGYAKDTTLEKLLEQHTKLIVKEENRFKQIFQRSPIGVAIFDNNTRTDIPLLVNSKWCEIFGRTEQEILNTKWYNFLVDSEDINRDIEYLDKLAKGNLDSFSVERKFKKGNGSEVWINLTIAAYETDQNGHLHNVCMAEDITKRKQVEQEIERISYTDGLTQLYNRNYLLHRIKDLNQIEIRPVSVIIGDVNGLKVCNDAFGHTEGDNLIKGVGKSFAQNIPNLPDCFSARIGGDEFCAVLVGVSKSDTDEIIKRIKEDVKAESSKFFEYSVAMGCCTVEDDEINIDSMMKIAEEKMYTEKIACGKFLGDKTVEQLIVFLENDPLEKSHMYNVYNYCVEMGTAMRLPVEKIKALANAAKLHDIGFATAEDKRNTAGKALVPLKTKTETKSYRETSYRLLKATTKYIEAAPIVLNYNEAMDLIDKGESLQKREIGMLARIICLSDYYDAITNPAFGNNKTKEEAIQLLRNKKNVYFEDEFVEVFIEKVLKE